MTNLRGRKTNLFQYVAAAILVLVLFPGQTSAEQSETPALLKEGISNKESTRCRQESLIGDYASGTNCSHPTI